jgi:hypothetical protein
MSLDTEVQALTTATLDLFDAVLETKTAAEGVVDLAEAQAQAASQSAAAAAASRLDIQTNWQDKLTTAALQAALAEQKSLEAQGYADSAQQSAELAATGVSVTVNTVADLRALAVVPEVITVTTLGCNTVGDNGAGRWIWSATSTATDNTGTIIRPSAIASNAPGRWLRVYGDVVDSRWFGVVPDGVTDNATALQAAINSIVAYVGGIVFIPPNTAIGSTVIVQNKFGIVIRSSNGQGFGFVGPSFIPTLKWIGAAGGKMIRIINALNVTMRYILISGEEVAGYGLYFEGNTSGWGVSNYDHVVITGCTKNAVHKTKAAGAGNLNDYGRNHWKRCTFKQTHEATGVPMDDALYVYNYDSGVQDVFDHCEWIYKSAFGADVVDSYAFWVEAGTPRVHINDSYTIAFNGIFVNKNGLANPKFQITQHYSEDKNFLSLSNSNTRQVLNECVHARDDGVSITWGGASGGGAPLVINGGQYRGTVELSNLNAPVIFANAPQFEAGWPTVSDPKHLMLIGRSQGAAVAGVEAHSAFNGSAFVPGVAPVQNTLPGIYANLTQGSIFPATLVANTVMQPPSTIDALGRDVGRKITYKITGHATTAYTVTFNSIFKLTGTYTHSGPGKTDILEFLWDGTNWWETQRSVGMV